MNSDLEKERESMNENYVNFIEWRRCENTWWNSQCNNSFI